MEVAGLVVGVVPLVIVALKCFKSGKQLTSRVRNRRRHIETLIRALQSYNGYLELLSRWLLTSMEMSPDMEDRSLSSLMQNAEIIEKIREFLGTEPSAAFHNAIEKGRRAVGKIAENIDDLLPGNQSSALALKAITLRGPADIEVQFRKGIKLALGKEEIDEQVGILDASANDLARLHSVSASLHRMNIISSSNTSRRLANSLDRVRGYAVQLYTAISLGWSSGCHPAHEAKLVLEDRIDGGSSHKSPSKKEKQNLRFQVVFASEPSVGSDVLWHESEINVVDYLEQNESPDTMPSHDSPTQRPSIRVTFSALPPKSVAQPITTEVEDICLTIREAKRKQKKLQLYLRTHHRFHCHHSPGLGMCSAPAEVTNTINLEALLSTSTQSTGPSTRMPIRSRLLLALNLASTLLQLKATPWLATLWSKSTVCCFAPSAISDYSQIDLTRPVISVKFGGGVQITDHKEFPEARRAILELGIMLLELWHETTFEAHCDGLGVTVSNNYFDRARWAQEWLETSSDSDLLLPDYHDLVAHCIRCDFANNAFENQLCLNPTWENERLTQGFITGVIEPLRKMCRGSRD